MYNRFSKAVYMVFAIDDNVIWFVEADGSNENEVEMRDEKMMIVPEKRFIDRDDKLTKKFLF